MPLFSAAELDIIAKEKKKPEDRPSYYSASDKTFIQISESFEGYLILQPIDQKQKILSWVQKASKEKDKNIDRDALLQKFLNNRKNDAKTRVVELDKKLEDFNSFKSDLVDDGSGNSRYTNILEISLLSQSLQKPVDELMMMREQAAHEVNMVSFLTNRLIPDNSDTKRELQSWQTVLAAYKGQSPDGQPPKSGGLGNSGLSISKAKIL